MAILCIDTATEVGTVAVVLDGDVAAAATWRSASRHDENLFTHIESVLGDARVSRSELTLIGVDIGPGRFTSLRVGLSTAKGLAFGLDLPIVGVSSLRALARSLHCPGAEVRVPLMNAYRGDLFAAAYGLGDGVDEEIVAPQSGPPDEVLRCIRDAIGDRTAAVCGDGVRSHGHAIEAVFGVQVHEASLEVDVPTAQGIAAEVQHVMRARGPDDLSLLEPQYLRPSDAKLPAQALRIEPST